MSVPKFNAFGRIKAPPFLAPNQGEIYEIFQAVKAWYDIAGISESLLPGFAWDRVDAGLLGPATRADSVRQLYAELVHNGWINTNVTPNGDISGDSQNAIDQPSLYWTITTILAAAGITVDPAEDAIFGKRICIGPLNAYRDVLPLLTWRVGSWLDLGVFTDPPIPPTDPGFSIKQVGQPAHGAPCTFKLYWNKYGHGNTWQQIGSGVTSATVHTIVSSFDPSAIADPGASPPESCLTYLPTLPTID